MVSVAEWEMGILTTKDAAGSMIATWDIYLPRWTGKSSSRIWVMHRNQQWLKRIVFNRIQVNCYCYYLSVKHICGYNMSHNSCLLNNRPPSKKLRHISSTDSCQVLISVATSYSPFRLLPISPISVSKFLLHLLLALSVLIFPVASSERTL